MPYADLREFLTKLEAAGKLHRITQQVDKDWEIAAVSRIAFQSIPEPKRPALMFENVKGFDVPVVLGVNGASRSIYCLSLECELGEVQKKWS
jgi:UbiD family decarboxylase